MSAWYHDQPPRPRRRVAGGIRARNKRGAFGETWWGRRWSQTLDELLDHGRLQRGRTYARQGAVLTIEIAPGEVRGAVQGSRREPYACTIELAQLSKRIWKRVAEILAARPLALAQLMAGQMPDGLDALFDEVRAPLFPTAARDFASDCSCPDWANPCKHLAAVYCLLAEEFDREPFLLLRLRGRDREALLAEVEACSPEPAEASPDQAAVPVAEPLPCDPATFWQLGDEAPAVAALGDAAGRPGRVPLLDLLGGIPLWRVPIPFADVATAWYDAAAARAAEVLDAAVAALDYTTP